jgi:hypothetical protein
MAPIQQLQREAQEESFEATDPAAAEAQARREF